MVKGVNRQIIEINDTGNKYIEKALLFVTPGKGNIAEYILQNKAQEYLLQFSPETRTVQSLRERCIRKVKRKRWLLASSIGLLSLAALVLIINIF